MSITGRFLSYLDKQNRVFLWLAVMVSVLGIGIIDYKLGPGLSLSPFYIFPVALASWTLGTSEGFLVSFICAVIGEISHLPVSQSFASLFPVWDTIERLGILITLSLLFAEIHALLKTNRVYRTPTISQAFPTAEPCLNLRPWKWSG